MEEGNKTNANETNNQGQQSQTTPQGSHDQGFFERIGDTLGDLKDKTVDQLRELGQKMNIPGAQNMDRDELQRHIEERQSNNSNGDNSNNNAS